MAKLQIRCWKTKTYFEIETDDIPDTVYNEALMLGIRDLLNRGMTSVPPNSDRKVYHDMALGNIEKIYKGQIRFSASVPKRLITPEAMAKARAKVKAKLRKQGIRISSVLARDITRAAMDIVKAETRT